MVTHKAQCSISQGVLVLHNSYYWIPQAVKHGPGSVSGITGKAYYYPHYVQGPNEIHDCFLWHLHYVLITMKYLKKYFVS